MEGINIITMNGYQLQMALDFVAPDLAPQPWYRRIRFWLRNLVRRSPYNREYHIQNELETELSFGVLENPVASEEDGIRPAGLYCWLTDYPEEGAIHLPETPCEPA